MLLTKHKSYKNPEIVWEVHKNELDIISCNCPICFDGGCCRVRQQFLDRQFRDQMIFAKAKHGYDSGVGPKPMDLREIVQESLVKFYGIAPGPDRAPYPPPWRWMMR